MEFFPAVQGFAGEIPSRSSNQFAGQALDQHGHVIRLSYMEIASGINRWLRRGIPKEVISQVLDQPVEALAKEANARRRPQQ